MAFVLADRVKETTTTTGTGTISLAGALAQFQSFVAAIGNGNTTAYAIASGDGVGWEIGVGTVTSGAPNTLSRTTILASSSAGAAIALSGTSIVFCTNPAHTPALFLAGATSGFLTLQPPDVAASSVIKLPAGTTDFSATGGANRFIGQASAGAAFTVTKPTSAITGDTSGGNAAAGELGEYGESVVAGSAAVAATSGVNFNVTSFPFGAGDYDVYGNIESAPAAGCLVAQFFGVLSTQSATFGDQSQYAQLSSSVQTATAAFGGMVPYNRFSFSVPTTVYLVCQIVFSGGTTKVCGFLKWRRVR